MNANKSILDLYADLGDAVMAFDRAHTVEHYRRVLRDAREATNASPSVEREAGPTTSSLSSAGGDAMRAVERELARADFRAVVMSMFGAGRIP